MSAHGAAAKLKKAGFTKVSVLDGGLAGWRQAEMPVGKGR
jgi:rhodanese-related sulfurtransferase